MTSKNTVIIVIAFGVLAIVFVFFLIGVNRATDPNPNREADLRRLAAVQREEDVRPEYDANDTAIVTLREDQKSGPVIVKEISASGEVKINLLRYGLDEGLVTTVLHRGERAFSCPYDEIRLLRVPDETATFRFKLVKGSYCPICWHMYQPEIYGDYITVFNGGLTS